MTVVPWACRSCIQALTRPARQVTATRPRATTTTTTHSSHERGIFFEIVRRASSSHTSPPGYVPVAILERVRKLKDEYNTIQNSLKHDFDKENAKRMGQIQHVVTAYQKWDNGIKSLESLAEMLEDEDRELRAMAKKEAAATERQLEKLAHNLTVALTPKHAFADLPCLLEIRPGPGGHEGRLFADSVFRMYRQYCARKGYQWRVVKVDLAEGQSNPDHQEEPILEAVIEISDEGAYGDFRSESGIHRVQRVPATEKSGRTHTSAVAVWVMPSFPDTGADPDDWNNPDSDFYIPVDQVKAEKMRAGGAGGQHVNKTESAIRLTHIPTGITVSIQDSRSQHRNRDVAWRLLRSRVAQVRREEREERAESLRSTVLAKDKTTRGDKIRTYNYSQNRCSDHRSGLDIYNLPDVVAGGEMLGKLVSSAKEWMTGKEVRALIAEEEAEAKRTKKREIIAGMEDKNLSPRWQYINNKMRR